MSVIQDESMEGFDPDSLRIPAASLTNLHPSHTSSQEAINSGAEDSYASPIRGPRRSDFLGAPNEDSELHWSKRTPNDTVHPDHDKLTFRDDSVEMICTNQEEESARRKQIMKIAEDASEDE